VADKPYCDRCGRAAFIKFYADQRKAAAGAPS
jgi:hypothetical protein